jgi:hypothetical protein
MKAAGCIAAGSDESGKNNLIALARASWGLPATKRLNSSSWNFEETIRADALHPETR